MEQSLCRALVFNHSATNMQSFLLNSSKFISAVSGSQRDSQHKIEVSNQILHPPMSSDQMPSLPGKKRRQMPGRGGGGAMLKAGFHQRQNHSWSRNQKGRAIRSGENQTDGVGSRTLILLMSLLLTIK